MADKHPEMKSMGTTMTMVYIVWPRAFVVHVGDSRCYLLHAGQLEQVTRDHTISAVMAEIGQLTADEARNSPMRHALWNVIGGRSDDLSVDVYKLGLEPDDKLLLCTDGLTTMLDDEAIGAVLEQHAPAEAGDVAHSADALIARANAAGGADNISVAVAWLLEA